jgi:BlaI family penicillinase repressor
MEVSVTPAELEVLRILWRENRPLKISEFRDELEQKRSWSKSTTQTVTARLRDKGYIEPSARYGVARYVPLVTEEDYLLSEEKAVIEKFGNGKTLAMAMVKNGHLSEDDIAELRAFFKVGGGKSD